MDKKDRFYWKTWSRYYSDSAYIVARRKEVEAMVKRVFVPKVILMERSE